MKYSLGLFVVMGLCLLAQAQTTFDLSGDFSLQNNPNKVWQYGYSETNSLAPDQFRLDKYSDGGSPIGFWHPATSSGPGPGYYPYVAYNTTKQSQAWPSPMAGWCAAARSPWKRVIAANTVWFASWRPWQVPTK